MRWSRTNSWLVIALATILLIGLQAQKKAGGTERSGVGISFELAGKYAVGIHAPPEMLDRLAHTPDEQLALVITQVALGKSAEQVLRALPAPNDADTLQAQVDLRNVLQHPLSPAFADAASRLKQRLGWFGDLAATYHLPESDPARRAVQWPAQRLAFELIGASLLLLAVACCGLALLIVAIVMFAAGKLKPRFERTASSPFFLEAFAIYLGGMAALNVVALRMHDKPVLVVSVVFLLCLPLALLWPKWRGLSWRDWRDALGFNSGRGFFRELAAGVVGYVAGLPILAVGMLLSAILMRLSTVDASHPIVNQLRGSLPREVMLFALAALYAPFTEELFFRGAFLGYLRQRWPFVPAALLVSLIFAAIHPQGWPAIPLLASVTFVLSLIREWRGSIIGCMAAHALNNGTVLLGVWILLATIP